MTESSDRVVLGALATVIEDHGWQVATNPNRLRASMSDVLGAAADSHRGALDALAIAVDEGVTEDMRLAGYDALPEVRAGLSERLVEWGLSAERAEWTIDAWADVLPPAPPPPVTELPPVTEPPVTEPPVAPDASPVVPLSVTTLPEQPGLAPTVLPNTPPLVSPDATELPPDATELPPDATELPPVLPPEATELPPSQPSTPSVLDDAAESAPPSSEAVDESASNGRLIAKIVAGVAVVVLAGIGLAMALRNDDPATESDSSDDSSSTTPATTPQATPGEVLTIAGVTPEAPAETLAMGARKTGVELVGLEQAIAFGSGDNAVAAPDGGNLIAFTVRDWDCEITPCTPWTEANLDVVIDGQASPLPTGDGANFVVAVPASAATVDLQLTANDVSQTVSLLTGEPGPDNIVVLARDNRTQDINDEFVVVETTSVPVNYSGTEVSRVERSTTVQGAQLDYFVGGKSPKSTDLAYLKVDISYTIPLDISADLPAGTPLAFTPSELQFLEPDGTVHKAIDRSPGNATLDLVFEVPADLTRGRLQVGGQGPETVEGGNGVSFTRQLSKQIVKINFAD